MSKRGTANYGVLFFYRSSSVEKKCTRAPFAFFLLHTKAHCNVKCGGWSWLCLKQSLDWIAVRREMLTTTAGKWEMRMVSPRKATQRDASDSVSTTQATQPLDKRNWIGRRMYPEGRMLGRPLDVASFNDNAWATSEQALKITLKHH